MPVEWFSGAFAFAFPRQDCNISYTSTTPTHHTRTRTTNALHLHLDLFHCYAHVPSVRGTWHASGSLTAPASTGRFGACGHGRCTHPTAPAAQRDATDYSAEGFSPPSVSWMSTLIQKDAALLSSLPTGVTENLAENLGSGGARPNICTLPTCLSALRSATVLAAGC